MLLLVRYNNISISNHKFPYIVFLIYIFMKKDKKELNARLAVKAFIVHKNKLLIVKRAKDEVHMPEIWELPGGRLNPGEDPFIGIIREIREETGLY